MSLERTMMSQVRTLTALIEFGLAIVQLSERFAHGRRCSRTRLAMSGWRSRSTRS
jgi:uncharacterized membrane protein YidH (DUF202 family)